MITGMLGAVFTGPGRAYAEGTAPDLGCCPRRPRSLVRQGRGGYYSMPGPNARLESMKQAAAEDVADVRGDDRFYAPGARGREEDDLQTRLRSSPSHASRMTRNVKTLLQTLAAAPARYRRGQRQDRSFFVRTRPVQARHRGWSAWELRVPSSTPAHQPPQCSQQRQDAMSIARDWR
jgi:hypothetical protein